MYRVLLEHAAERDLRRLIPEIHDRVIVDLSSTHAHKRFYRTVQE